MQKQAQNYRWRVTHKAYGTVEVEGVDRLRAIIAAAMTWKQRWDANCQSVRDRKAGASVTRKQGCSSCAWAFREEQPGGMTRFAAGTEQAQRSKHLRGRTESGCCSQVPVMEELPSYFRREWTAAQTEGRQPGAEDTSFRKNISRNRAQLRPVCRGQPPGTDDGRLAIYIIYSRVRAN